ncbi:MAG: hypothetical protein IT186_27185 [Acidobacteria bacterium]|nr:hypothetical protein [Acidobacteriota bacterium]
MQKTESVFLVGGAAVATGIATMAYARLTGYSLGYPRYLGLDLPLHATYVFLVSLAVGHSLARSVSTKWRLSGVLITMCTILFLAVLSAWACKLVTGGLDDLAKFVRVDASRVAHVLTPAIALGAYFASRKKWREAPALEAAGVGGGRCPETGAAAASAALGFLLFLFRRQLPLPDPMVYQLLILLLVGAVPGLLFAASYARTRRLLSLLGLVGCSVICAI